MSLSPSTRLRVLGPVLAGVGLLTASLGAAHATVISGSSSAYAESIDLTFTTLFGSTTITSGPLPTASGTAPPPYNVANSVASLSLGGPAFSITAGILNAAASSTVDGLPGSRTTAASASIANFAVSVLSLFPVLSATLISSTAQVSGDFGSLTPSGSASITGLTVLGVPVAVSSAPNTVLFNSLGLEIISNAQTVTADSIAVDALDITFDDVGVGGLASLSGSIILSHSQAEETAIPNAVPEPISVAILCMGLLGLGLVRQRG